MDCPGCLKGELQLEILSFDSHSDNKYCCNSCYSSYSIEFVEGMNAGVKVQKKARGKKMELKSYCEEFEELKELVYKKR